ncbi:hypothetical protein GCM10009839_54440 [Catenulispora yoronensis]|uniref:MbtH-like domain-containing protein n=1 Tax=Catenulispora yoronensis TaxID=450799 RepID=A0ABN2UV21_9ACTN
MAGEVAEEYVVVVNGEEQYSIWPGSKAVPAGWRALEVRGSRQECVDHVDEVWTDLRPRSLREFLRGPS